MSSIAIKHSNLLKGFWNNIHVSGLNFSCFVYYQTVTFSCCFWFNTSHGGQAGCKVLKKYGSQVSALQGHIKNVTCIGGEAVLAVESICRESEGISCILDSISWNDATGLHKQEP